MLNQQIPQVGADDCSVATLPNSQEQTTISRAHQDAVNEALALLKVANRPQLCKDIETLKSYISLVNDGAASQSDSTEHLVNLFLTDAAVAISSKKDNEAVEALATVAVFVADMSQAVLAYEGKRLKSNPADSHYVAASLLYFAAVIERLDPLLQATRKVASTQKKDGQA